MVRELLKKVARGFLKTFLVSPQQSEEEQFELIVSEIEDHPDKLFVWQFPGDMTDEEMRKKWDEYLEDTLSYGMKSEHIAINWKVDIDTLVAEDNNVIRAREEVFKELTEE